MFLIAPLLGVGVRRLRVRGKEKRGKETIQDFISYSLVFENILFHIDFWNICTEEISRKIKNVIPLHQLSPLSILNDLVTSWGNKEVDSW